MKAATVIVRVDEDIKRELEVLASKDRRGLSDYIRIIFEDLIKEKKKKKS